MDLMGTYLTGECKFTYVKWSAREMKQCHGYLKALNYISPPVGWRFSATVLFICDLQSSKYLPMLSRAVVLNLGFASPQGLTGRFTGVLGWQLSFHVVLYFNILQ